MTKYTKDDFIESQESFSKWLRKQKFENRKCLFQIYDLDKGFLIEKWQVKKYNSLNLFLIIEMLPQEKDFILYKQSIKQITL